jgi:hypothetical protein
VADDNGSVIGVVPGTDGSRSGSRHRVGVGPINRCHVTQ